MIVIFGRSIVCARTSWPRSVTRLRHADERLDGYSSWRRSLHSESGPTSSRAPQREKVQALPPQDPWVHKHTPLVSLTCSDALAPAVPMVELAQLLSALGAGGGRYDT